jgi:taurine dioxygenase
MPDTQVRQVGGRIGAEIAGVRLGGDLSPETVAVIRAALLRHRVIFFRDQGHLDDASHLSFAELLGPTTAAHPIVDTGSKVLTVAAVNGMAASSWHTDVTFVDRPPAISVLRGVTIPPFGGNTCWANTVAAYEALPAPLRAFADAAWAAHSNQYDYAAYGENGGVRDDERMRKVAAAQYETEHPVVRVHPETGERALLLGHFVTRLLGFNSVDSDTIFKLLQSRISRLENTVRWTWAPGDVAIWDNRSTQHCAVADFGQQARELRRITIVGDIPVSITGEPSRMTIGEVPSYSQIDSLVT